MSPETGPVVPIAFFKRTAPEVARDLLGAVLVSHCGGERTAGRIIETEAYLGVDDPASHAYRGRRHVGNESIYASPGTWYVYRSYGVHWCANLVTAPCGSGGAVLIRALAPLSGLDAMRRRRRPDGTVIADGSLCDGPGKLTQALAITRTLDGVVMTEAEVVVEWGPTRTAEQFETTRRVGITKAADRLLRFVVC